MYYNYDKETIIDSETKELFTIDSNGEIISTGKIAPAIPMGASIRSQEQINQSRKYFQERENKKTNSALEAINSLESEIDQLNNEIECNKKNFRPGTSPAYFWVKAAKETFNGIRSANIARLVYLAALQSFTGKLMKNKRYALKPEELREELHLKKTQYYEFRHDTKNYITIVGDEVYFQNPNIFRGKIKRGQPFENYQRVFAEPIKQLFRQTATNKLGHLGLAFLLLPYLNRKFNVLCLNPLEDDWNKVELMTMTDVCQTLGYDESHAMRLQRDLEKLKYDYNGKQEFLFAFVGQSSASKKRIMLNPHFIYVGDIYESVRQTVKYYEVLPTRRKTKKSA